MESAGAQVGKTPRTRRVAFAIADRVQRIDVETGAFGFRMPQRHEAATQLWIVDEVGAVQAQFNRCNRDVLHLRQVDDIAAELTIQHHHDRPICRRNTADEAVTN